jgi:predicted transcriptional regulator
MTDSTKPALSTELLEQAARIASAYVSNNPLPVGEIPNMIREIHAALTTLANRSLEAGAGAQKPAVPIKRSVTPEYIVCLEDGKRLKMLKRYLRSKYGLSPDQYRAKWNLPTDYPMTAPNYASLRSQFAKKIGLGRRTIKLKTRNRV